MTDELAMKINPQTFQVTLLLGSFARRWLKFDYAGVVFLSSPLLHSLLHPLPLSLSQHRLAAVTKFIINDRQASSSLSAASSQASYAAVFGLSPER